MKTRRCGKGAGKNKRTMKKNRKTRLIKKTHKYKKTKFNRKHRKTVKIGGQNDNGYILTKQEFADPKNENVYFDNDNERHRNIPVYETPFNSEDIRIKPAYEKVSGRKNNNKLYNVNGSPIKEENPYAIAPPLVLENDNLIKIRLEISKLKKELKELLAKKSSETDIKEKKNIDLQIKRINSSIELNDGKETKEIAKIRKEEEMKEFANIFQKNSSSYNDEKEEGRVLPDSERIRKNRSSNKKDFTIRDEFVLPDLTEPDKVIMREKIQTDITNGIYINNEIINALFDPDAAAEIIKGRDDNVANNN
jgi:hypothetical protein